MKWKTVRNNSIAHWTGSLRVVWRDGGTDVCYVTPCDDDNGNTTALMIASLPDVFSSASGLCDAILSGKSSVEPNVIQKALECKRLLTGSGFSHAITIQAR
jgi:hypothetical protein